MPVHHVHVAKPKAPSVAAAAPDTEQPFPALPPDSQTTAPATQTTAPATTDATPAPVAHKATHTKTQAAAAQSAPAPPEAAPVDAGQDSALPLALDPTEQRPIVKPSPHRQHAQTSAPQTQLASINPATTTAPAQNKADANLSKRSEILFAHGETDPPAATINKMHVLAGDLNTLLSAGAQRVLLDAYGGTPGDKSSDARRISLKRALVVRQLLIENGVPASSIDVRAMGGIDDSGAPDRVDVFVRA
jgi:outer membrane protein OmpA-like peptidoglycan-associated protein